ncbi:MAG: hypothetical protein SGJ02_08210, partial [bacterium]|nr:hypothetical protein [bacterium]
PAVLRPKLVKGRYALNGDWQRLTFDKNKTVWGDEPAADILTNHLMPEMYIIYIKKIKPNGLDQKLQAYAGYKWSNRGVRNVLGARGRENSPTTLSLHRFNVGRGKTKQRDS